MSHPLLSLISGVAPGISGTGWLLRGLIQEVEAGELPARFLHKEEKRSARGLRVLHPRNLRSRAVHAWSKLTFPVRALALARQPGPLLLLHPQTIGHDLFARIILSRRFTWIYVLDSYFFCRAGYNHLPSELSPCLRCLGTDGAPADDHGCRDAFSGGPFVPSLRDWVRTGRLGLVAQCRTQADLLRSHFGETTKVAIVPLHVPDIEPRHAVTPTRPRPLAVFHGSTHPAKGIGAMVALARCLPDWDFLVPGRVAESLSIARLFGPLPDNVRFQPMTWEEGLAEAVAQADAVICPSAWSAPVEGALLKSLARNGVVVAHPDCTTFASELPAGAFIPLLPGRHHETAHELERIRADADARIRLRMAAAEFVAAYAASGRGMAATLIKTCS